MAKRLSWVIAGHQSAPGGLEWLPSSSKRILARIDLGRVIIDPHPSFQTVWLNQKCWYLKNGGVGWKQECASLQAAHHTVTWHLYFPKTGIVWEVGGNGEAPVNSSVDVVGYDIIQYVVYHCTSLQLLSAVLPPFFQNFQTSDIEITWFWKRKSWSTKTRDADSKHVLHLCADTSSRLGSFFRTPNQWPFLVVCWNQFIPQQGSYNQTFKVLMW